MQIIGLIMEVNPFHNGHKYFLKAVKERYPNDLVIVVISTTTVQRGEVSVLSKEVKTDLLLDYVDLVVELPLVYTNQGGQYFGYYSIKILNDLGVDKIVFGSETGDLELLKSNLIEESSVKDFKNGYLKNQINSMKSNDILGISYIKAIMDINQNLEVDLIKRVENDYNDQTLNSKISSATAIRKNYKDLTKAQALNYLPERAYNSIVEFDEKVLLDILKIKLLDIQDDEIFLSENGQLIKKIRKTIASKNVTTLKELALKCSDKNNSKYKFQRIFINIILNIKANFISEQNKDFNKYKILGFSTKGKKYLKNNELVFFSYKEIDINNSIYRYNEKIDKLLSIFLKEDVNYLNYQKPIIKDKE